MIKESGIVERIPSVKIELARAPGYIGTRELVERWMDDAATLIAELQAERGIQNELLDEAIKSGHTWKERALAAESSLHRVRAWQPIETAPKSWIIGYTSWGQHVGKFHEHVGPCEYIDFRDHHEFTNTDFDAFPSPTHWMPWPKPPALKLPDYRGGEAKTAESCHSPSTREG